MAALLNEHKLLLLEFQASWCEPCKWAEPVVKDVLQHFNGTMHLQQFDIDEHPALSKDFSVLSVPTFVLMKEGVEVWRMRGFDISPVMIRALQAFVS